MIIKTRASLSAQVIASVKEKHSYATPAILVLPIEGVEETYFNWLMAETEPPA
jgi:periplasmic divalent cation tolerance protein